MRYIVKVYLQPCVYEIEAKTKDEAKNRVTTSGHFDWSTIIKATAKKKAEAKVILPDETKSLESLVDFVSIYKPKLITIGKNCKLRELKEFDTSSRRYWKFFRGVPIKYLDK